MAEERGKCDLLWTELEVFSKLIIRGRNQHRREKYYQMLVRVSRLCPVVGCHGNIVKHIASETRIIIALG